MPRFKRSAAEAELDVSTIDDVRPQPETHPALQRLRNMWEFASLMQFIYTFGGAIKIDEDFDIEDLEQECLREPASAKLAEIGLTMLKYVSSHRGLTADIFAEYTRRQYLAKAPSRNPFGDEEDPTPFNDLDIFQRIRILQQLSTWTFTNPDRMRGLMPEGEDELAWRMEPLGWDADDREYYVLDDNRLYRRTDEELPPSPQPVKRTKPKAKPKKKSLPPKPSRGTRASKRLKIEESSEEDEEDTHETIDDEDVSMNGHDDIIDEDSFGFTDKTWECIAITLEDYQSILATFRKSRDANEKVLRRRIEEDVLPLIEKRAEAIRAKELKKLRELENLQKMATAKRSSRLADKAERNAKEEEERAAEEKKAAELRMVQEEQDRQRRIEEGHESRRLTREQRLKEREVKRILHEEELQRLDREASAVASQPDLDHSSQNGDRIRLSSRNLQNQKEAHRKELDRLEQDLEEDKWYFDCVVCGMHGENMDDGSHSVACERCNVWQHSSCHGFTPEQCENENFHFVCSSCRKKDKAAQAAQSPQRSGLILKLGKRATESPKAAAELKPAQPAVKKELPDYVQRQLAGMSGSAAPPAQQNHFPQMQPNYSFQQYRPPTQAYPPQQQRPYQPPPQAQVQAYPHQQAQSPYQGHTQQHAWLHNQAVNGAGGHPPQASPPAQRPTPQSPATAGGQYQPPQSYNAFSSQARSLQSHPSQQIQQTPQRPSQYAQTPQTHGINGYQPNGTTSGQQNLLRTPQVQNYAPQQKASPLQSSPHASIPPPSTSYNKTAAISPEKSSPPRPVPPAQMLAPAATMNGHSASPAPATSLTPNASFENAPKLTTPIKNTASPMGSERAGDSVAAHGMQGPWPEASMAVPTKAGAPASSPPRQE